MRKATELPDIQTRNFESIDDVLKTLMLDPFDFSHKAIYNKTTRSLIDKIIVEHGGKSYDAKYPDGIPSSVIITLNGFNFIFFSFFNLICILKMGQS